MQQRLSNKTAFVVAEALPALLILIVPFSVHAGFFNKMMGVFTQEVVASVTLDAVDHSALNTQLLASKKSADPVKATGGGDVFYEDGVLVLVRTRSVLLKLAEARSACTSYERAIPSHRSLICMALP
jgi:hypothetical protein